MQHLPAPIHHARDAAQLPVAIDYPAALALRQMSMVHDGHCCKVSDEAAFCLIQRPYISKTLL
ncbi:hypothetical protein ACIAPE_25205, partial [Salmonella enterica subsp. enterica serovar Typhimurium]